MKRSGPLKRKTALALRSSFKRTPAVAYQWPEAMPAATRKPMKRTPSKGRTPSNRSKIPKTVRAKVVARSGGKCEAACSDSCQEKGGHLHHKLMRSQGGKHTVDNLIDVCLACHGHIHAQPKWSYEHGFLVRRPAV